MRAGLGLALVPESASSLRFKDVLLRPIRLQPLKPVELHLAWRRKQDIPLLPSFLAIARALAVRGERA